MRTIIDLTEDQLRELHGHCADARISRAEAVRRAVDAYLQQQREERWQTAKAAAFGMWKDRGLDALAYERTLRDEWER